MTPCQVNRYDSVSFSPHCPLSWPSLRFRWLAVVISFIMRTLTSLTSEGGVDSELLESAEVFVGLSSEGKSDISVTVPACEEKMKLNEVNVKQEMEKDAWKNEPSKQEMENVETREPRQLSEKKSKRQKSLKGIGKTPELSKHPESGKPESSDLKLESDKDAGQTLLQQRPGNEDKKICSLDVMDSQQIQSSLPENFSKDSVETFEIKSDMRSSQLQTEQRAWKPCPGFKAKSLLEIQEEEQKRAASEAVVSEIATSVNSMSLSASWTGIVGNIGETQKGSGRYEDSLNSKSKKSKLHDLFVEEVFSKASEGDNEVSDSRHSSSSPIVTSKHSESIDDDSFIEAKDTKKSRKKAAKAKGAGMKAQFPVTSADISTGSSPIEKVKSACQAQQEKESIPTISSGPSLSDFVFWKGESGNSSPTPAWSTDAGKVSKPTSLRDIQKEQERRISSQHPSQIPTPRKAQPTKISCSNGPSWPLSASSPSKAVTPIPINSHVSSQSKIKGDDDLFWGPIDHSKQETQQVVGKQELCQKKELCWIIKQTKIVDGKASDSFLSTSSTVQSTWRGKIDAKTKHSEAMDFRDWCENECVPLIGSKDTSFLEFCLKQTRSEAELLSTENLGLYDPDHEFIEKFLNYKELVSDKNHTLVWDNV